MGTWLSEPDGAATWLPTRLVWLRVGDRTTRPGQEEKEMKEIKVSLDGGLKP